jgi:hypothetical protein
MERTPRARPGSSPVRRPLRASSVFATTPIPARSYSGGKPTDYKVTDSGKVVVQIKETRNSSDTETKYYIWSGGKDNASPITLRKAGGKWYVDEWSSLQTGVRK